MAVAGSAGVAWSEEPAEEGDKLEIDPATGEIVNLNSGQRYTTEAFPPFLLRIIEAGGLHGYVQERLDGRR